MILGETENAKMHYRNKRPAANGDPIVNLDSIMNPEGPIESGTLRDAVAGDSYCNGNIQTGSEPSDSDPVACLCDCLHREDLAEIVAEKGLDKRPKGM